MTKQKEKCRNILKQGLDTLSREKAKKYFGAYIACATNEKNPIDVIFDLIENNEDASYKIKIMNRDTTRTKPNDWQIKKKTYDSYKKFMRYGKDIFKRYHNVTHYNGNDTYCILYKMIIGKWVKIDPPKEFLNVKD